MTQRKAFEFTVTTSATTTSQWFLRDFRRDENPYSMAYFGTNTSGGHIQLQVAVSTSTDTPTKVGTLSTLSAATFNGTVLGNWPMVRFIINGGDTGSSIVGVL